MRDDRCPIDYADPDLYRDGVSYRALAAATEVRADAAYTPVLGYDALRAVSKDNKLFSSEAKTILVDSPEGADLDTQRNFLLNMDEPRHGRVRRIVAEAFSVRAAEARRPEIARIVAAQADRIMPGEPFEFVNGFATPVTLRVILMLMGLDDRDIDFINKSTEEVVYTDDPRYNPTGQEGKRAAMALFTHAMQLYRDIGAQKEGSVLRRLTEGLGGQNLSQEEFCFFFVFILAAGYETTRSMLCNMATILADAPGLLPEARAHPERRDNLVEEMLRFDPPVIQMCRTATAATQVGPHTVPEGGKLGLVYPMANRDGAVFDAPHDFRPDRSNAAQHLAFGTGRHKCLGAHLAKIEMRCVLDILSARFDAVEVLEIDRVRSNFTKSTRTMQVRFQAAAPGAND